MPMDVLQNYRCDSRYHLPLLTVQILFPMEVISPDVLVFLLQNNVCIKNLIVMPR